MRRAKDAGDLTGISIGGLPDLVLYVTPGTVTDEISRRVDIVHGIAQRTRSKVTERRYDLAFASVLRFGVLPPLVLLIFGAAIGWAFAGFRKVRGGIA